MGGRLVVGQVAVNLATALALPPKVKEHPLVEEGKRTGLEGNAEERSDFLCLWLSASKSSACPPNTTHPPSNSHLLSR